MTACSPLPACGSAGKILKEIQWRVAPSSPLRPTPLVADIHDRMPVILSPEDYDRWLDPGVTDPALVADLLKPFDPRLMRKYPVSDFVNRPDNEGPECAQEIVADTAEQQKLW